MTISTILPPRYEFAFNVGPLDNTVPAWWQDLSTRVRWAWDAEHGRLYELDVNETGLWHATLDNNDGAFNPANTSSPFAPGVLLYRRARIRVPVAPTQNFLPQVIATGSATMNPVSDTVANWWYGSGTSVTLGQGLHLTAPASGQTTALAWTTPSGTTSSNRVLYAGVAPAGGPATGPVEDCVQVTAGTAYTASVYLSRLASADATMQITAGIAWFSVSGAALTPSAGSAATVPTGSSWVRATVTGTAPAGAVWGRITAAVTTPASTTAANTVYATGWQLEAAGAATSWADPGATAFIFTGMESDLPQDWVQELGGTQGIVQPVIVDVLAGLAVDTLQDPFVNELMALNPNFLYQLNDPAGSIACVDTSGNRIAAPVENSPAGAGSLTFGNTITSTNPTLAFVGAPGPVATFANNGALAPVTAPAETFVSIHKTTTVPGPPAAGPWTRMIAFRTSVATDVNHRYRLWYASVPSSAAGTSQFDLRIDNNATGTLTAVFTDSHATTLVVGTAGSVTDGNWHLVAIGADPTSGAGAAWLDGVSLGTTTGLGSPAGITGDTIGCEFFSINQLYDTGFVGDLAFAVELPVLLTNAQATNLYSSWRSASSGESTGARIARVLSWAGWTGRTAIDVGATQSMGPATDLTGTTALDALNSIAVTENGDVYASTAGVITFKARTARYNSRTPVYVFGEGPPVGSAGEWPCEIGRIGYDASHLAGIVQVTQYQGPVYQAVNRASGKSYFRRTFQRQINVTSGPECQDAATYLLGQLKDPHLRVETITLHPSAMPGLMAVCLALEKGLRIRLVKRPMGAAAITVDCFVERVQWSWDPDTGDVFVTVEASPADLANYGVLAALHTTLNVQAASGQNKATINALGDAAANMLASSLPSGYSLTFEPGTARAETLALAAGGIPATSLGYSTAQLTFTANLAFTHAANTIVCEPLPAGYTDPTVWDASAVSGAAYTTVLSGGASGTNTVTVGPLVDSNVNGLGQDWNTGDVIWLSPGTPNFEAVTILSVPATYPGYPSCVLTLTANLAHNHTPGDWACDPLPAGVTDPTTIAATLRLAY